MARGEDSLLARWLDVKPIRYVGKISMSAYLWHVPIMLVLARWGLLAGDTLLGMTEEPVMNAARRYRRRWA